MNPVSTGQGPAKAAQGRPGPGRAVPGPGENGVSCGECVAFGGVEKIGHSAGAVETRHPRFGAFSGLRVDHRAQGRHADSAAVERHAGLGVLDVDVAQEAGNADRFAGLARTMR